MKRFMILTITLLVVFSTQASAITIKPGTYKLRWRAPGDPGQVCYRDYGFELKRMDGARARLIGLKSDNAMSAVLYRNYVVIIDESKGTSTGYDTGYITAKQPAITLSRCTRFSLVEKDGRLRTPTDPPILIHNRHDASASPDKPVALQLDIQMPTESGGVFGNSLLLGGWFGVIDTDEGKRGIQTFDRNGDGVFGNAPTTSKLGVRGMKDEIAIEGRRGRYSPYTLGKAVACEGKFYQMQVSSKGDTIRISPYTETLGTIVIEAQNGSDTASSCQTALFSGGGGTYYMDVDKPVEVPPGSYICQYAFIMSRSANMDYQHTNLAGVNVKPLSPVVVTAGKTTKLQLGGPLSLEIVSPTSIIQAQAGTTIKIETRFKTENAKVLGISSQTGPAVQLYVKDEAGNIVAQSKAEDRNMARCFTNLTIPMDCKPGDYRLTATFDPSPYQSPIEVEKTLRVTE